MSVDPQRYESSGFDLHNRFLASTTVVGSPAAAAETIIAQVTVAEPEAVLSGILLDGWAAFTVGTSGTAVNLRIRRTNVAGAIQAATGAVTGGVAAGNLLAQDVAAFDAAPTLPGQIYVLTMQVTAGAATSTVSAVRLSAIVV